VIEPAQKDEVFLADVRAVQARGGDGHFRVWWLGQSGFLLQWQDHHLLFDPYLSDSLTKKYAPTDKPHVRMTERVIAPERLDFLDIVTSSHNHTDHLDAETLLPLRAANPHLEMVIPEANRAFVAQRLQSPADWPCGLDAGGQLAITGFTLHAVPAAHEKIDRDAQGRCLYLGYVVRFGEWAVYHSGDTVLYEGMADLLRPWRIDLAFLPINGAKPERRVSGNLGAREAAELGREIGARCVIPCHYEMFEFNTADPRDFEREARRCGTPHRILRAGESWSSRALPPR